MSSMTNIPQIIIITSYIRSSSNNFINTVKISLAIEIANHHYHASLITKVSPSYASHHIPINSLQAQPTNLRGQILIKTQSYINY